MTVDSGQSKRALWAGRQIPLTTRLQGGSESTSRRASRAILMPTKAHHRVDRGAQGRVQLCLTERSLLGSVAVVRRGGRVRGLDVRRLLVGLVALSVVWLAISGAAAQTVSSVSEPLLKHRLNGTAALAALGGRVAQVAAQNGKTVSELAVLLRSDPTLWVDPHGQLLYIDDVRPGTKASGPSPPGVYPYDQTFRLNSRPTASRVIFLDFDGGAVLDTAWNSLGRSRALQAPPFDLDGDPSTFNTAEMDVMQGVWRRVAEDYAAFDVNVTTQDWGVEAIRRTSIEDVNYGTRVLITPSMQAADALCGGVCGGIAFVGHFDDLEPDHSYWQPAWVFTQWYGSDEKNIAEAASHEAGHTLGLHHDGLTDGTVYYSGQGAWAPIMGNGYNRPITQWSKGEYAQSNNTEDDFAVMVDHGLPLRDDDYGDSIATAFSLGKAKAKSILTRSGVISSRSDIDYLSWRQSCSGVTSIMATPALTGANLDVRLRVFDVAGTLVAYVDPTSQATSRDTAVGLASGLTISLPAGTYFIEVDGVGSGDVLTTGYSDYASVGNYTVEVRSCRPHADNDAFSSPVVLVGESGTDLRTNSGATPETAEPSPACGNPGELNTVWWQWTAPQSGLLSLDTTGSDFDTILAVYSGATVTSLTPYACNDGSPTSGLTMSVTAGTTYAIQLDGTGSATGNITLNYLFSLPTVINDDFASAPTLTGSSGSVTGSNIGATREPEEPTPACAFAGDVNSAWWRWTAPETGTLIVSTAGSDFDTILVAYTGSSLATLAAEACNDDSDGTVASTITVNVTAGTTYSFQVDGYGNATGDIRLGYSPLTATPGEPPRV